MSDMWKQVTHTLNVSFAASCTCMAGTGSCLHGVPSIDTHLMCRQLELCESTSKAE